MQMLAIIISPCNCAAAPVWMSLNDFCASPYWCIVVFCVLLVRWARWLKWPRLTWTASGRASAKVNEVTSPSPTFAWWNSSTPMATAEAAALVVPPSSASHFLSQPERSTQAFGNTLESSPQVLSAANVVLMSCDLWFSCAQSQFQAMKYLLKHFGEQTDFFSEWIFSPGFGTLRWARTDFRGMS